MASDNRAEVFHETVGFAPVDGGCGERGDWLRPWFGP